MENQDKKAPVGEERKPRPEENRSREGGNGEGGGQNRRRNRNRRRGHGNRDSRSERPEAAEGKAEGQRPEEGRGDGGRRPDEGEHEKRERRDGSSEGGSGENRSRNRRRNRNRNRNRRHDEETAAEQGEQESIQEEEAVSEETAEPSFAEIPSEPETPEAKEPPAPELPRYTVAGIRFRPGGKIYYFDPNEFTLGEGAHVVVETARGPEYGVVALGNRSVSEKDVVLPLRKVLRLATEEDERRHEDNLEKETEAYNLCLSRIEAHRLDMKLVDVEYAFDNSKLLFYFTSEERVDFRELVKDLASVFRTRIELRQIGIRDEAKLMGGLGVCGRPFCCKSFLPDFVQVSIKMAKEQNLSLNSAKISGACGRLMCCLRYEYDTYLAESALTPKVDAIVDTPDGEGVVIESSPLKGTVKVSLNKEQNASRLYRREDCVVKGHMKKRKNNENEGKKPDEKK